MVNKKITFMHGHWCSSFDHPGLGRLQRSPDPDGRRYRRTRKVTERGLKNIFRIIAGRDDQQGLVAGTFLAEHFKGRKIAVVDDKSAYGKGLADESREGDGSQGCRSRHCANRSPPAKRTIPVWSAN
jgi:branched-chain amino acid transport system substrate-binding protein